VIVVDSSALVDLAFESGDASERVEVVLRRAGWALGAPHLVDVEVLSAARRLVLSGRATAEAAGARLDHLWRIGIRRFPHVDLRERIWELREHVTAADAAYVALAEALDVPLVTTDRRLARAHGFHVDVIVP